MKAGVATAGVERCVEEREEDEREISSDKFISRPMSFQKDVESGELSLKKRSLVYN